MTTEGDPSAREGAADDVWTYRGYRLRASEFTTAMVHFYRGELARSNTWRLRLDTTTNWAVITTGAVLSLTFGAELLPHFVLLIELALVLLFWWMESRRYRHYELWAYRVRLMETDFFAAMLLPPFAPGPQWADKLSSSLLTPEFPITMLEALGRRFRRNYQWLILLLIVAWLAKLAVHPIPVTGWEMIVERAVIGRVTGVIVMSIVLGGSLLLLLAAWATVNLRETTSEVLPHGVPGINLEGVELPIQLTRRERLAIIITQRGQEVAESLMGNLHRGVTSLDGVGCFTGESRNILLCAITPQQVNALQKLVRLADPTAFVIINQAHEVMGRGFEPLSKYAPRASAGRSE